MYITCSHPLSLPLNHNRSFGPEQDFHTQLQDRFVCKCVNLHKKVGKPVTCCCQGHNYWHRFSRTCEHLLQNTSTTLKTSWVVAMSQWKVLFEFFRQLSEIPFASWTNLNHDSDQFHIISQLWFRGKLFADQAKGKEVIHKRKSVWCSEKWQGRTIYLQRRRKGDFPTCQGPWIWRL